MALGVGTAGNKTAAHVGFLHNKRTAAFRADPSHLKLRFLFFSNLKLAVRPALHIARKPAFRIAGARKKRAGLAELHDQGLAAFRALQRSGKPTLDGFHGLGRFGERRIEFIRKALKQIFPGFLPFCHPVEPFLHAGREVDVHEAAEVIHELLADHAPEIRGHKALFLQFHVIAILKG